MLGPNSRWSSVLNVALTFGAVIGTAQSSSAQTIPAYVLRDLPNGGNMFAVAETMIPEVVADRFNSGGLNPGLPARLSGLFGSWSQTRYRIGEIDISSPMDGTPLIFPRVLLWDQVEVAEVMTPLALGAPGLVVSLTPIVPSARGAGAGESIVSGGPLTTAWQGPPPANSQLDSMRTISLLGGAAVRDGVVLSIGGAWSRTAVTPGPSHVTSASGYMQASIAVTERDSLAALAIVDSVADDEGFHLQGTWTHYRGLARRNWRISAAYTIAQRAPGRSQLDVVERLAEGTVPVQVADRRRTERLWSAGVDSGPSPATARHGFRVGANVRRATVTEAPVGARDILETVDGIPARIWSYAPVGESRRSSTAAAAFVEYRVALSKDTMLTTGARYEFVHGAAAQSQSRISWHSVLPAAHVSWDLGTPLNLTFTTGLRRTGNRLLLGQLTVGDPASPAASVYPRISGTDARGPLVARVGPGTPGDAAFSAIDPGLRRAHVDEFAIGITARPRPALVLGVRGVARRQAHTARIVNVGVTAEDYRVLTVRDDNADLARADDDQALTIYERLPGSFGRDRYLLTNVPDDTAAMGAVIVSAELSTPRLYMFIGGTASAATGKGSNRGFRAEENDRDALGELYGNPNAATYARGRLFSDRAYTVKWSTVYHLPWDMRVGVIARYQDGQPFSRLVIASNLNQGPEIVQAFARGRSRFAFTGTIDVRLQKSITLAGSRVDTFVDLYNLPDMRKETEEYVVTGLRFREASAVQPPRAIHLGLRVRF